jgi:1-deoxy-D-xylulose-5-phosphate synthase
MSQLLEQIKTPGDLRKLPVAELPRVAQEIRERVFHAVSVNGGHLASNLGVVELTMALHYVYDFGAYPGGPDRLLFDVGHQCYPHKMLTGRADRFEALRKRDSISGFPAPDESAYDLFAVGHAGTAISTAVGMARGDGHMHKPSHVVAVVGDASIVNGLAFEGLNNAGTLKRQLLIVLNDNGMSISKPQGALAQYLERVRVSSTYEEAKRVAETIIGKLPTQVGHTIESVLHHVKEGIKSAVWPGQLFESLGIKYMGPVDGHDLPGMIQVLSELKHVQHPVLLHVKTIKGKGYDLCCNDPTKFHSPAAFTVQGTRVESAKSAGKSWTTAYAEGMMALAKGDARVVALTAAMPDGTGLSKFEKEFPERYYDTGICESHLVAMAAGMAKSGMRPFAAIYSTFVQRAFDQVWQEVVLNGLPVALCLDRAGYVGDDGAVHHGFMDLAFLRPMPGMVLMAPSDEAELNRALRLQLGLESASAIRYPRDAVPAENFEKVIQPGLREAAGKEWSVGRSRVLREGADATVIVYGALVENALAAADLLAVEGCDVAVIDARFCKPLDGEMLAGVLRPNHAVLTIEDHALQNGFGTAVAEYAVTHNLPTQWLTRVGHPDRLLSHATRREQLAEAGLDIGGLVRSTRDALRSTRHESPAPSLQV